MSGLSNMALWLRLPLTAAAEKAAPSASAANPAVDGPPESTLDGHTGSSQDAQQGKRTLVLLPHQQSAYVMP